MQVVPNKDNLGPLEELYKDLKNQDLEGHEDWVRQITGPKLNLV